MKQETQKDWEKEFDKRFPTKQTNPVMHPEFLGFVDEMQPEEIKPFISQALSSQKEEFKKVVELEGDKYKGDGLHGKRGDHYEWLKESILKAIDEL